MEEYKAMEYNYKTPVGPPALYDYCAGLQLSILFNYGLRANHKILDFGCGSLRLGRLLIQYLDDGNYYGIEPDKKLVEEGIKNNHLGELIEAKTPRLHYSGDCDMDYFNVKFDYIIAYSIFTHMPIEQVEKSLASAYGAMRKETIFLATYFEGKRDNSLKDWTGNGIFYKPHSMFNIIRKANLIPLRLNLTNVGGQVWLLIRK